MNIAIENCPMIFSWDEWPGGTNLASTPAAWDEMFSLVPSKRFGLNLDPSHLVWLQIDYERVVRDYAKRILHVHAKDMEIDRRRPVPARHRVAGDGLADPAAPRPRRGAMGAVPLPALRGRLRRRRFGRARGPRLRAHRRSRRSAASSSRGTSCARTSTSPACASGNPRTRIPPLDPRLRRGTSLKAPLSRSQLPRSRNAAGCGAGDNPTPQPRRDASAAAAALDDAAHRLRCPLGRRLRG